MKQRLPSYNFLAQAGHVLLGYSLTVTGVALGFPWWSALVRAGVGAVYMFTKEFTYDLWVEKDTVKGGWRDITFWAIGTTLAGALLAISKLWR